MTTKTKILFLDLDGTLFNDEKKVTEGNRKAIEKALDAGHKIVITTGRALPSAKDLAKEIHLDQEGCYILAYNGGATYDLFKKRLIHTTTLSLDLVHEIMERAHSVGMHTHTYSDTEVVSQWDTDALQEYLRITQMTCQIVPDIRKFLDKGPCKVLAADYHNHEKLVEFQKMIAPWAKGKVDMFHSSPELLEMVPVGVSKGSALLSFCQELGIPLENTVSAGDADNDISMLKTAHIGAVMKNAPDYMYPYGNYITQHDNNHDGIAEIIQRFILSDGAPSKERKADSL